MTPKKPVVPGTARPPMTKPGPQPGDNGSTKARPPYRFDDGDRARAAETRKRQYVETAVTCNACYAQRTCPEFQPGSVCAFEPLFKKLPTRDTQTVISKLKEIIAASEERAWLTCYFEQLDGGKADKSVTVMFNNLIAHHLLLARLYRELAPGSELNTVQPGTVLGDIFGANSAKSNRGERL